MSPLVAAGESRASLGVRDPDGAQEVLGLGALAEEAGGAGPQGGGDVLVDLEGRQHHHAHGGEFRIAADHAGGGEPVGAGHPDVHQHDVGARPPGELVGLRPVGGLPDDLHVGLGVHEHLEGAAQQSLVVGEQDLDRCAGRGVWSVGVWSTG